jgi:hypothetical protein
MLRQNGADRSKRSDKIRNNYGHGSKRHFCLLESPISRPPTGLCPSKSSLPGTEFLDAETGGQKSALETADVQRDRKPGDDTGEISAETASFGVADEMRGLGRLGGGVRSQIRTGLRSKFRDRRELTGQIREFGPFWSAARLCNPVLAGLSDENSRVALTGNF